MNYPIIDFQANFMLYAYYLLHWLLQVGSMYLAINDCLINADMRYFLSLKHFQIFQFHSLLLSKELSFYAHYEFGPAHPFLESCNPSSVVVTQL